MTPHPKLFQLFQPNGGVTAGLPGAAMATGRWGAAASASPAAATTASAAARSLDHRTCPRVATLMTNPIIFDGGMTAHQ
ncbi:hypothetical protein GCM10027436_33300 [Actinophytocola sediminis]